MAGSTDHPGRVQAQGGGTERSVPWAQSTPPTAGDGQRLLDQPAAQLSSAELQARQEAFAQAREFINRASQAGGVGPMKKSFPPETRSGRDPRRYRGAERGCLRSRCLADVIEGETLMVRYLCTRFLADAAVYEAAQARWRQLWERVVCAHPHEAEWQVPWFAPEFANGTPMRDGNPIFTAVSPTLRRGVRVIQHEPATDQLEFDNWTDTFQGDEPIAELVISCALSEEAEERAYELMRRWITTGRVDREQAIGDTAKSDGRDPTVDPAAPEPRLAEPHPAHGAFFGGGTEPLFGCFRGDCDNAALETVGAFSVRDSKGRNWLCFEPDEGHESATIVIEGMRLQQSLHAQSMSNEGTEIREVRCRDREELAVELGKF